MHYYYYYYYSFLFSRREIARLDDAHVFTCFCLIWVCFVTEWVRSYTIFRFLSQQHTAQKAQANGRFLFLFHISLHFTHFPVVQSSVVGIFRSSFVHCKNSDGWRSSVRVTRICMRRSAYCDTRNWKKSPSLCYISQNKKSFDDFLFRPSGAFEDGVRRALLAYVCHSYFFL